MMKRLLWILTVSLICLGASAQKANVLIRKGNDAYKKQQFDKAAEAYQGALSQQPASEIGQYNLGNALYRSKKLD